jgi:hypothetical protein
VDPLISRRLKGGGNTLTSAGFTVDDTNASKAITSKKKEYFKLENLFVEICQKMTEPFFLYAEGY